MRQFLIHEANMERLEKKLATIAKKCAASHTTFHYEVLGEQYLEREANDGSKYTAKFFEIEVEGEAKYNGWRFIATLDHHEEGNVIRAFDTELTIPDKYKTCGPVCEHCNKIRSRKDTYLIYNDETGEFKQVGKSCLKEFTNGLSAEDVAFFVSIYEEAEQGYGYSGSSYMRYINVEDITRYAFECYKHWGYQKSEASFGDENGYVPANYRSTRERATDYYFINRAMPKVREQLQKEIDEVGFDANSDYAVENAKAALEWIKNEQDLSNEYIRNLHIICSDQYTEWRSLGILVSLTTAYMRHIDKLAAYEKKQKEQEELKKSEFVGEIGNRLTITATYVYTASFENDFGICHIHSFKDENGNVLIWKTGNCIDADRDSKITITGTVKDHNEYRGTKQTILTRCKVKEV